MQQQTYINERLLVQLHGDRRPCPNMRPQILDAEVGTPPPIARMDWDRHVQAEADRLLRDCGSRARDEFLASPAARQPITPPSAKQIAENEAEDRLRAECKSILEGMGQHVESGELFPSLLGRELQRRRNQKRNLAVQSYAMSNTGGAPAQRIKHAPTVRGVEVLPSHPVPLNAVVDYLNHYHPGFVR
jgi:hypothetical protein